MKSFFFAVLIFGSGLILPWWIILIASVVAGFFKSVSPLKVFSYVLIANFATISYCGKNLLEALNFGIVPNNFVTRNLVSLFVALIFASLSGLIVSLTKDTKALLLSRHID